MESKQVTQEELKKVFNEIDKDQNGYISLTEISIAAKELGIEVTNDEVKELFDKIDENHDGKITFVEFSLWWSMLQNKQLNPQFKLFRLKAVNFLKKLKPTKSSDKGSEADVEHSEIVIKMGDTAELGTKFEIKTWLGKDADEKYNDFRQGIELDRTDFGLVLKVRSDNPESSLDGFKDLIDETIDLVSAILPIANSVIDLTTFKYHNDDKYIYFIANPKSEISEVDNIVKNLHDFGVVSGIPNIDAVISTEFGFKYSFLELRERSKTNNTSLIKDILAGFLFQVHAQIPASIGDGVRNSLIEYSKKSLNILSDDEKSLLYLLLAKQIKINLNLKGLPSDLKLLIPELGSLDDLFKPLKEKSLRHKINEVPIVPQAVDFAKENLKTDFSIGIKILNKFTVFHFKTNGIKEIFSEIVE